MTGRARAVARLESVTQRYGGTVALDGLSLDVPEGCLAIQLSVDATAMVQAGLGAEYAQQIITTEIANFLSRAEGGPL